MVALASSQAQILPSSMHIRNTQQRKSKAIALISTVISTGKHTNMASKVEIETKVQRRKLSKPRTP